MNRLDWFRLGLPILEFFVRRKANKVLPIDEMTDWNSSPSKFKADAFSETIPLVPPSSEGKGMSGVNPREMVVANSLIEKPSQCNQESSPDLVSVRKNVVP